MYIVADGLAERGRAEVDEGWDDELAEMSTDNLSVNNVSECNAGQGANKFAGENEDAQLTVSHNPTDSLSERYDLKSVGDVTESHISNIYIKTPIKKTREESHRADSPKNGESANAPSGAFPSDSSSSSLSLKGADKESEKSSPELEGTRPASPEALKVRGLCKGIFGRALFESERRAIDAAIEAHGAERIRAVIQAALGRGAELREWADVAALLGDGGPPSGQRERFAALDEVFALMERERRLREESGL